MLKCKSHIYSEPKHGKAMSLWPKLGEESKHPLCGGNITMKLEIKGDTKCYCGDYCYCEPVHLALDVTCSRCRNPFVDERLQNFDAENAITSILEIALSK